MSSSSEINANVPKTVVPSQQEDCPLTIHLGIVFGGNSEYQIQGSWIASNYDIEENATNRKYTIVFNNCVFPTIEEQFEPDGMQSFGERIGETLYKVFAKLHDILSGYLSMASNLIVEIDTFCIEEGFFCASMFCEAVEHGCFDELPAYAPYAIADVEKGGIFEDLRMRGASVVHHSFTTFQTMPNEQESKNTVTQRQGKGENKAETKTNITMYSTDEESASYDNEEYVRANEDQTLYKISIQKTRFEGLYSKLCNIEEWLGNTALACDIVAFGSSVTVVGASVGAVCELMSMGLSGIDAVVCFALAGMAAVDGNTDARNQYLQYAGLNCMGIIPFGSIIAKSAKGAKFATKKETFKILGDTTENITEGNKIAKFPTREKPSLNVVENSSTAAKDTSNVVDFSKVKQKHRKFEVIDGSKGTGDLVDSEVKQVRPKLKVIEGGKQEGEWVKVANGTDIYLPQIRSQLNIGGFGSVGSMSSINNQYGFTRSFGQSIKSYSTSESSKYTFTNSTKRRVEEVSPSKNVDNNTDAMHGQQRAIDIIKGYFERLAYLISINKKKYVNPNSGFNKKIKLDVNG